MKVFISWSGEESKKVASALRDWLPSVIQKVVPYFSPQDIEKGTRWSNDIALELEKSDYGIICVTKENTAAPWINFEAGALSKKVDKSRVTPFLFRILPNEFSGPLRQFQCAAFVKEDVKNIVVGINAVLPDDQQIAESQLAKSFDVWWPLLEKDLQAIEAEFSQLELRTESKSTKSENEYFDEILTLLRQQHTLLNSPEAILPRGYFEFLSKSIGFGRLEDDRSAKIQLQRIHDLANETLMQIDETGGGHPDQNELLSRLAEIRKFSDPRTAALVRARRSALYSKPNFIVNE